jgi:hypothetical protein
MKRAGCFVLLPVLFLGMAVASNSEVTKPVTFHPLTNPQPWALGDRPSYLVVTEKNWPSYYSSQPKGADFAANIYVIASLGLRPNPGYTVRILQLQQRGEVITVKLELGEPAPNKFYIQVMVKPIAVVEVSKTNLQPNQVLTFLFIDQKGNEIATIKSEV